MPQVCVPDGLGDSEQANCYQLVPHEGSQILRSESCSHFHPASGFVEQMAMAATETLRANFPQCPRAPRSKFKNITNKRSKPQVQGSEQRTWRQPGRKNKHLENTRNKLLGSHHSLLVLETEGAGAQAFIPSQRLTHLTVFTEEFSFLYLISRLSNCSLSSTSARCSSFANHLNQVFSTGIDFALQGTFGNMWR